MSLASYVFVFFLCFADHASQYNLSNLTNLMHKILFYNKSIIHPYMFQALCAHHQEVRIVYTASGIVTPVGGHPVHGKATCKCDDTRGCIV